MYAQKNSWHICLFVKSYGNICLLWIWNIVALDPAPSARRRSTCRDTPCLKRKSVQRYLFWGTCNESPMSPTHDTHTMSPTQQSPRSTSTPWTWAIDTRMKQWNKHKQILKARASPTGWHRTALFYQSRQRIVLILPATQSTTTHAASESSITCRHE